MGSYSRICLFLKCGPLCLSVWWLCETVIFEDLKREFTTAVGKAFYFRTILFFTVSEERRQCGETWWWWCRALCVLLLSYAGHRQALHSKLKHYHTMMFLQHPYTFVFPPWLCREVFLTILRKRYCKKTLASSQDFTFTDHVSTDEGREMQKGKEKIQRGT